ncbi:amidohydrolase family protein [Nocardia shimofusensis]|uniref:amidohydrolase family protein n=1 Tax=Nocardia shimofusensis TaxID=228596 RepID=UPI0008338660|nr:amidohydrolase family protein [Nocardia shimofusensis]
MNPGDLRVIDAHIHQWDPLGTPRGFSTTARLLKYVPLPLSLAVRLASVRDREFVGDPTAYLNPYLPADYRADAAGVPVEGVVHIEVEWHGKGVTGKAEETRWVAGLPFGIDTPPLSGIVGSADPAAPGFADLLDAHQSASPLLRGIRTMVAHHPDPDVRVYTHDPSALTSRAFLHGFGELAKRDLVFEAWVYSHQLPQVNALAARYPEVTIVLNHLATPAGVFGGVGRETGHTPERRRELLQRWCDDIAELAAHPKVVAKVSGLAMPILGHPVPRRGHTTTAPVLVDRIRPLVTHALDCFGPDRLIWGSNFPVDKAITTIPDSVAAVSTALTEHGGDGDVLAKAFHDNAARVYRIEPPS